MTFLELSKQRESVRKYSDRPVEREKIERCLEAARLAPSACNSQPWKFVVVDDSQLKDQVARQTFSKLLPFNQFTIEAPVIVAIVMEKPTALAQIGGRIKDKDFYLMDIGIVAEHFCLQAAEEGLGTCMLGWFNEKEVIRLLGVPKGKRIGLLISLGYPTTGQVRAKVRKSMERLRTYNRYLPDPDAPEKR